MLFVCWAGTIFALSCLSGAQLRPYMLRIPQWDKICHTIAFAAGAVVLGFALRKTTTLPILNLCLIVFVTISFYGATDEFHQQWTPGRSALDFWDWLADTAGATLGAFVTYAGHRVRPGADARAAAPAGD